MAVRMLDLSRQQKYLQGAVEESIKNVLIHGKFVNGPEVAAFENWLCAYTGFKYAVGVSSGTDALLISLMAEGIGKGDAVFLPDFTYVATAEIILMLGAHPVFVDVDHQSYQISTAHLKQRIETVQKEKKLTPRAIIGVDLFGQPAPWDSLYKIAETCGLNLYNDCAQSFGASYGGESSGKQARAVTLSFFPAKPLGAYGDGGAILTDCPDLAEKYRSLRNHGMGKNAYDIVRIGLNARLDTIQAAILLAKTESFETECDKRREHADFYTHSLSDFFEKPCCLKKGKGVWSVYTIRFPDQERRDKCREFLKKEGIEHAVYYETPLHRQPAYQAYHDGTLLESSLFLAQRVLSLPIHAYLLPEEREKIVSVLNQFAKESGD